MTIEFGPSRVRNGIVTMRLELDHFGKVIKIGSYDYNVDDGLDCNVHRQNAIEHFKEVHSDTISEIREAFNPMVSEVLNRMMNEIADLRDELSSLKDDNESEW